MLFLAVLLLLASSIRGFQSPSSTTRHRVGWTRSKFRRSSMVTITSLLERVSNETESSTADARVMKVGDSARNADDSDRDFERVRDSKFLERNKHWVVLIDDEESIRLAVGDYLYDSGKFHTHIHTHIPQPQVRPPILLIIAHSSCSSCPVLSRQDIK
jgi:hypothetical protein